MVTSNWVQAMVNIYVARHGQDLDNVNSVLNGHRNQPLTELGKQQAKDVANKMLKAGFTVSAASPQSSSTVLSAIYSSPLKRAHETAEIFARVLSGRDGGEEDPSIDAINVEVMDDLIERDFGIMTGQPTSSIVDKCGADHILATEKINYFLDPEGAETFPNLIDRANRLLAHIEKITEADSTPILLVTHGDFGKMVYAAYYNLAWENVLMQFHFGNSEVLLLAKDSPPENAHVFRTSQYNS
mmetsp:Transcript_8259/g.20310  ORF Transcript_8259/g.20310 Transcript_8259/m.20310 type:complete len:242 (+) Transcript_8259:73-798(+)